MAWLKRVGLFAVVIVLVRGARAHRVRKADGAPQGRGHPGRGAARRAASASAQPAATAAAKPAETQKPAEAPPSNEKLEIKDLVVGKGTEAKTGDTVKVHYVGTLPDGKEFDSSKKHNQPFDFELGAGRVIKGWDQGVAGMKIGGKRKLTVPPSLGYGARGFPPVIPPNATLIFEVELLEVKKK